MPTLSPLDPGLRALRDRLAGETRPWLLVGADADRRVAFLPDTSVTCRVGRDLPAAPAGGWDGVLAICPQPGAALPDMPGRLAALLAAAGPGGRLILILPALESVLAAGATAFWQEMRRAGAASAAHRALEAGALVADPVVGLIDAGDGPEKHWLSVEVEEMIHAAVGTVDMARFAYVLPDAERAPELAGAPCDRWHWGWDIRLPAAPLPALTPDELAAAVRAIVDRGEPVPAALSAVGDADWCARAAAVAGDARDYLTPRLDFGRVFRSGGHVVHVVSLGAAGDGRRVDFGTGTDADPAKALCIALFELLERGLAGRWRPDAATEAPYRDLGDRRVPLSEWDGITPARAEVLEGAPLATTEVTCLRTGAVRLAPAAKVGFYPTGEAAPELRGSTSVGLALGTDRDATVLSAALEVLERHAFKVFWDGDAPARPVTVDLAGMQTLCAACEQELTEVQWFDITGSLPVPVILCRVRSRPSSHRPHGFSLGLAAGWDVEAAMSKALKEAIQTDFGRGEVVNAALARTDPQESEEWTPEARILYWAGADAPVFPAEIGEPIALSRLAAAELPDTTGAFDRLNSWCEKEGVELYARDLAEVEVGGQRLTVARVIGPRLRDLRRVEARDAIAVPHPFF